MADAQPEQIDPTILARRLNDGGMGALYVGHLGGDEGDGETEAPQEGQLHRLTGTKKRPTVKRPTAAQRRPTRRSSQDDTEEELSRPSPLQWVTAGIAVGFAGGLLFLLARIAGIF